MSEFQYKTEGFNTDTEACFEQQYIQTDLSFHRHEKTRMIVTMMHNQKFTFPQELYIISRRKVCLNLKGEYVDMSWSSYHATFPRKKNQIKPQAPYPGGKKS